MASVRVDVPPLELGIFEDQWHAVTSELEEAGHDVAFEEHVEQRGGWAQLPPGVEPGTLVLIALYVGKKLAGETVDKVVEQIVGAVLRNLRGRARGNPRRKVVIVDEFGRPLKAVDVPRDDADEKPGAA